MVTGGPRNISANSGRFRAHFPPRAAAAPSRVPGMNRRPAFRARLALAFLAGALGAAAPLRAQDADAAGEALAAAVQEQARALALDSARPGAGLRVEVELGRLDPRLRLAPCRRVEPYLPTGYKPWGRTRVGLRCLEGAVRWNVYMPMTVKVYGVALVAATSLPAGTVLSAGDVGEAEVDLAAESSPVASDAALVVGRTLTRTVAAGEPLRQNMVRPRQWFGAGETVQIVAEGRGFSVQGQGQALSAGVEGSAVRVRTESGRIVTGQPTGERRVEVTL